MGRSEQSGRPFLLRINMAETKVRYVLEDGVFYQESVILRELILNQDIITKFATEMVYKTPSIFNSSQIGNGLIGNVGMANKGKLVAFTLRIGTLPVRTKFLLKDGCMVPDFTGSETSVVFNFNWVIPRTMNMYLIVTMQPNKLTAGDQFLIATDSNNRMYRLPMSNIYEDCRLCSGQFEASGTSHLDVLIKCWNQFQNSDWQGDLFNYGGDNAAGYAQQMFRFKPLEGDAFEQQEVPSNWQTLCKKVGNELVTQLLAS